MLSDFIVKFTTLVIFNIMIKTGELTKSEMTEMNQCLSGGLMKRIRNRLAKIVVQVNYILLNT